MTRRGKRGGNEGQRSDPGEGNPGNPNPGHGRGRGGQPRGGGGQIASGEPGLDFPALQPRGGGPARGGRGGRSGRGGQGTGPSLTPAPVRPPVVSASSWSSSRDTASVVASSSSGPAPTSTVITVTASGSRSGSGSGSGPGPSSGAATGYPMSSSAALTSSAMSSSGSGSDSSSTLLRKMAGLKLVPKELQLGPFPRRPDQGGNQGTRIALRVNHFRVLLRSNIDLCQYDVSITPEVTARAVNRAVLAEVLRLYRKPTPDGGPHFGGKLPAYDGMKNIYTNGLLPGGETGPPLVFENISPAEEGAVPGQPPAKRKRPFRVVIKFAARINLAILGEYLAGRAHEQPQDAINALDIVLRESPTQNFVPVGRSFFSDTFGNPVPLTGGAQATRGFFQSLRPSQVGQGTAQGARIEGLTLNLDMSSTPFLMPIPVPNFVAELLGRRIGSGMSDQDRVKVKKVLRNIKVEVTHQPQRRRYRVSGVTDRPARELRFDIPNEETGRSQTVSLVDFFRNKYGVQLKYPDLPALESGSDPKRKNWLPMEVCIIAPRQRYVRKLNPQQTSNMLTAAKQFPNQRMEDIKWLVENNGYSEDPYAKEFGISVDPRMMEINARILPTPKLKYGDDGREKDCVPRGGAWNMREKRVVDGAQVARWACINFAGSGRDRDTVPNQLAEKFCSDLARMCNQTGLRMNPQMLFPVQSCVPAMPQTEMKLREVFAMASRGHNPASGRPPLDFLFCILPTTNSIYGDIKRIAELDIGIVTQCALAKHIPKLSPQYLANLALKINPKSGGRNTWLVDAKARRMVGLSEEPTIVFGADVTHPSPGDDSSPSIAAVVASQDWPEVCTYYGLTRTQYARQEMVADLYKKKTADSAREGMVTELIRAFRRNTNHWPARVLFFRDGVSEGQFSLVRDFEVDAIRKACAAIDPSYKPKITFVVVQKRHHTRMFPTSPQTTDRSGNVLPGTVVDTAICSPGQYDFFLCSHAGLLGVSRPAKYVVLWDDNRMGSNEMQHLVNSLCYTYVSCTRSVSVVPPAYYAHKLAFRARFYLPLDVSDSGSRRGGSVAGGQPVPTVGGDSAGGLSRSSRDAEDAYNFHVIPELKEHVKRVMFYC